MVATGLNEEYLGQWRYFEELGEIVITKSWDKVILTLDKVTGKAEFFEPKSKNDLRYHEEVKIVVKVPEDKLKETSIYCEFIDFNK